MFLTPWFPPQGKEDFERQQKELLEKENIIKQSQVQLGQEQVRPSVCFHCHRRCYTDEAASTSLGASSGGEISLFELFLEPEKYAFEKIMSWWSERVTDSVSQLSLEV